MLKKRNVELPEKTKVTHLNYANKPLALGGMLETLKLNEFYQKIERPFTYSDAMYSDSKHAPHLKSKTKSNAPASLQVNFERLGFADVTAFVVCNMEQVGHGVFATRDFEPGECFILYSGVIKEKSSKPEQNRIYAFSFDDSINLMVDADEVGNISRFIQHLPLSYTLAQQERKQYQLPHQTANEVKSADFWYWRNLDYKSALSESQVAWANLSCFVMPIQGVPCLVLYNPHKINAGEQLGFSYGIGYWLGRGIKPDLFDLKGNVIPPEHYGYKEIAIDLPLMPVFNRLPLLQKIGVQKSYNKTMFEKDLQRQDTAQPVWFSHFAEPVSIFKLRETLLQYHVIGSEYAALQHKWVSRLRAVLPAAFTIKLFARHPNLPNVRPIHDVVCMTDDLMKWSQLTMIIKGPIVAAFAWPNKCLKSTQEVIFQDILANQAQQDLLIEILTLAKVQGIFTKDLTPDLIPSGPVRGDTQAFSLPKSEEAYQQILMHNPGLTRKAIQEAYQQLEQFTQPVKETFNLRQTINSDSETKLNQLTTTFFKNTKSKIGVWKIYPPERLSGKYIGHDVRFFNLPADQAMQKESLVSIIQQNGFQAELNNTKDKSSIIVDLTLSK